MKRSSARRSAPTATENAPARDDDGDGDDGDGDDGDGDDDDGGYVGT